MEVNPSDNDCRTLNEDLTASNDLFSLLSSSFLPKQNLSLDQPLEADSFKEHVKYCEANFKKSVAILENQSHFMRIDKKLVISIILLCGEHSIKDLWTSPETLIYAKQLLTLTLERCKCSNVTDLLLCHKIDHIFAELRPKLLKNTWKNNPAAVTCFIWILFHIKCPELGDVLNSVLPTCLLLIDDHVNSNKIKGLQCIQHIANNVSRAELNDCGRSSVIYSALEHMIYVRETEIISPLAPCLAAFLSKTEHSSITYTTSWSHFDDVLSIWLPSMEMEQKLALREAYIDSLNNLIQAMGLASVRWSKKLLSVLSEYCEQDHTMDKALMNLQTFIQITWPRLSSNFQTIIVILTKVVIKLSRSSISKSSSQDTLKLVKQCFKLLEAQCNKEYNLFVNEMKNCVEMRDTILLISDHEGKDLL